MWAPSDVVPRHKIWANIVWTSLIMIVLSYTAWLFVEVDTKRKSPAVSVYLDGGRYPFPTLSLCPRYRGGCDVEDPIEFCANTVEALVPEALGFEYERGYVPINEKNLVHGECVDIRLSELAEVDDETGFYAPYMHVTIVWALGDNTTVAHPYRPEGVVLFMTDYDIEKPLDDHNLSTVIGEFPFSRIRAGDLGTELIRSTMMMQMTQRELLGGSTTRSYSIGAVTHVSFKSEDGVFLDTADYDRSVLALLLYQPSLSKTVQREIDPLQWTEIVGNVGGMWEIMLVLWAILFVNARKQEPRLKARNFVHSGRRAFRATRSLVTEAEPVTPSPVRRRRLSVSKLRPNKKARHSSETAERQALAPTLSTATFAPSTNTMRPDPPSPSSLVDLSHRGQLPIQREPPFTPATRISGREPAPLVRKRPRASSRASSKRTLTTLPSTRSSRLRPVINDQPSTP